MKHSILTLPTLLRSTLYLATASKHTFSVQDDLLAFPQYDVKFSEDFISESQAQARLRSNEELNIDNAPPSQVDHYKFVSHVPDANGNADEPVKVAYETMILDSQAYLCSIPQITKPAPQTGENATLSKAEEEKELARATDRGWELLQGMHGNCIYFISGWWSYRFCYHEGVRQFHQLPPSRGVPVYPPVEDPGVEGYTLGLYAKEEGEKEAEKEKAKVEGAVKGAVQTTPDDTLDQSGVNGVAKKRKGEAGYGELVQRGESRYLVQKLEGGTKCDLTGKERRVEVQVSTLQLHSTWRFQLTDLVPLQPTTNRPHLLHQRNQHMFILIGNPHPPPLQRRSLPPTTKRRTELDLLLSHTRRRSNRRLQARSQSSQSR